MDNYIVRVYRRADNDPQEVVGLVEKVGSEDRQSFRNLRQLCEILIHPICDMVPALQAKSRRKVSGGQRRPQGKSADKK